MTFWIAAAGIGLAVTALLLLALLRGRAEDGPAAAYDLQVYRDQLREVDRDLARGVIAAADAERLRTEVARRVLEADRALGAGAGADGAPAPRLASFVMAALVAAVMLGGVWTYYRMGAPGYPDLPIAARLLPRMTTAARGGSMRPLPQPPQRIENSPLAVAANALLLRGSVRRRRRRRPPESRPRHQRRTARPSHRRRRSPRRDELFGCCRLPRRRRFLLGPPHGRP